MSEDKTLPVGWVATTLAELLLSPKSNIVDGPFGSNLKASEYQDNGTPILRLQNIKRFRFISKNIKYILASKSRELARHSYEPGDIIITKLGYPLGEACILPNTIHAGIIVADLVRLRLDNGHIDKKWLCYAINADDIANQLKILTKGTTRPRVNLSHIRQLEISLPPLKEQKRIVARVDELFSELDKGIENLKIAQEQLKVYRQAVLKHAFEGKLTADWRKKNGISEDWKWVKLAHLCTITGGLTKNPKRSLFDRNIAYLRVANVQTNRLDLNDIQTIGILDSEVDRVLLKKGDLLIVEGNGSIEHIGRVAVWNDEIPEMVHQNHLIKARTNGAVDSRFILYFLLSPKGRDIIKNVATSTTGLHTLSISKVSNLIVPWCKVEEQQAIIELLESYTSYIDRMVEEIETQLKKSEALRQSILKKAFSGKLVAQDSKDEPASVLLECIRAEKGNSKDGSKKPREKRKAA